MKLGTQDRKKVLVLGGLAIVAGYLVYTNVLATPGAGNSASAGAPAARPDPAALAAAAPVAATQTVRVPRTRVQSDEFHPVFRSKRPEERVDPAKVDPTLRLDLLAKLQVEPSGNDRNLFQFGPPPAKAVPPKDPEPKVLPKPPVTAPPAINPASLAPPPPPPIPLRYFGSVSGTAAKTAFFLDGDDILVAKEGETVKRRYRVVRINASSVLLEDTESKRQQSIPMEQLPG